MKIFVIHDPRRPDEEFLQMLGELTRQGLTEWMETIHPTFIPGGESVVESINGTHKRCVRRAKEEGLEEVCILESDVVFPAPDGWEYFLKNKPNVFDLYLGGIYDNLERLRRLEQQFGAQAMALPITGFSGFHCYIIHSRYYDRYLGLPDAAHIDGAQAGQGVHYCCYPFAAIQRPGWSAINKKKDTNYNYILQPGDVYGDASAYGVGQK